MKEFISSISTKGQVTLPAEMRSHLGLKPKDKVVMVIEEQAIVLRPTQASLKAGFQSIPALRKSRSLEEMTEIAAAESVEEVARQSDPRS